MAGLLLTQPLVSVCIPVYNAAAYIEACLQSVKSQTYQNIEVIVVDNGSTDGSLDIAQKHEDARLKVLKENKRGASAARNKCLSVAKGEFVQFMDADDLLSPDKIAEQVQQLILQPRKVAVCSTVHFPHDENCLDHQPSPYEEQFLVDSDPVDFLINLYGGNSAGGSMVQPNAWLCPMSVVLRAGKWNETLTLDDDGEFFCRVVLLSEGVVRSKGLNFYRKYHQPGNLSSAKENEHLLSQYRAASLKVAHLRRHTDSKKVDLIAARWLNELRFRSYPICPELTSELTADINKLNFDYHPPLPFATPAGRLLAAVTGWKAAKRVQHWKAQLRKIIPTKTP